MLRRPRLLFRLAALAISLGTEAANLTRFGPLRFPTIPCVMPSLRHAPKKSLLKDLRRAPLLLRSDWVDFLWNSDHHTA